MNIDKLLNVIRVVGKYLTICTVIVAVVHGIVFRQFWAPFQVSVLCWIGIFIWLIGAGGLWLRKRQSSRSSKRSGAYKAIK